MALKTTRGGPEDEDFGLIGCLCGVEFEVGTVTCGGPEDVSWGCPTGVEFEVGVMTSGGPEDVARCGLGSGLPVVGFEVVDSGMIGRVNGVELDTGTVASGGPEGTGCELIGCVIGVRFEVWTGTVTSGGPEVRGCGLMGCVVGVRFGVGTVTSGGPGERDWLLVFVTGPGVWETAFDMGSAEVDWNLFFFVAVGLP